MEIENVCHASCEIRKQPRLVEVLVCCEVTPSNRAAFIQPEQKSTLTKIFISTMNWTFAQRATRVHNYEAYSAILSIILLTSFCFSKKIAVIRYFLTCRWIKYAFSRILSFTDFGRKVSVLSFVVWVCNYFATKLISWTNIHGFFFSLRRFLLSFVSFRCDCALLIC